MHRWGVSWTPWTGTTTSPTAPIPWPISRSPACLCVARYGSPWGLRLYRRDEALPHEEATVARPVPNRPIPRANRYGIGSLSTRTPCGAEPACRARQAPCRTQIALAVELMAEASRPKCPWGGGLRRLVRGRGRGPGRGATPERVDQPADTTRRLETASFQCEPSTAGP